MAGRAIIKRIKQHKRLYASLLSLRGLPQNTVMRLARLIRGMDGSAVVFSSFDCRSYCDNTRYVSEALHALRPDIGIIWLFRDVEKAKAKFPVPDYVRCLRMGSIEGLSALGRARVIVDNYNKGPFLKLNRKKQYYIQTWHGDRAFKKVGYDYDPVRPVAEEYASLCVSGSDYGDRQIRSAFRYKGEILKVGYPRNDILVRNDPEEAAAIRRKLCIDGNIRLLMYAPTYRDADRRAHQAQRMPLDLNRVLDTLEKTTGEAWKCLVRTHYLSFGIRMDESDRLIDATDYPEMAELLLISDALITDYSSCAGDYALLRRPIFLYQDDLADYQGNNRSLYFRMEDSPYFAASDPDQLDRLIEGCTPELARENCDAILKFYGEAETGYAAEKIAQIIIEKTEAHK